MDSEDKNHGPTFSLEMLKDPVPRPNKNAGPPGTWGLGGLVFFLGDHVSGNWDPFRQGR